MTIQVPTPSGLVRVEVVEMANNLAIHVAGLRWAVSQVTSGRRVATFPHRRHAWDFIVAVSREVPAIVEGAELGVEERDEVRRLVVLCSGLMAGEAG